MPGVIHDRPEQRNRRYPFADPRATELIGLGFRVGNRFRRWNRFWWNRVIGLLGQRRILLRGRWSDGDWRR